jgi:hypothetical protein
MLKLEAEDRWKRFLARHYDNMEHGDCDECLRKMYPRRTVYTKAWLRLLRDNLQAVKDGRAKMPELEWRCAAAATQHPKSEFHDLRCPEPYNYCRCDLAVLLDCLSDTPWHRSLEQILSLWKQVK